MSDPLKTTLDLEKESLAVDPTTNLTLPSKTAIFESVQTLHAAVNAYFQSCSTKLIHPTYNGLALSIGISRRELLHFPPDQIFSPIIMSAKQRIAALVEESLLTSRNATGAFAWLKNNDEWTDKSEVTKIKQVTAAEVIKLMSEGDPIDGQIAND